MGACQAPSKDYKFYIIQPKCVFPMNYQDNGSSITLTPESSGGMLRASPTVEASTYISKILESMCSVNAPADSANLVFFLAHEQ